MIFYCPFLAEAMRTCLQLILCKSDPLCYLLVAYPASSFLSKFYHLWELPIGSTGKVSSLVTRAEVSCVFRIVFSSFSITNKLVPSSTYLLTERKRRCRGRLKHFLEVSIYDDIWVSQMINQSTFWRELKW